MAEEQAKTERTINDVQADYSRCCNRAGELQYKLFTFQKDLDLLNNTIRDLNLEAAGIQARAAQAEQAAKEAATPEVTT